MAKISPSLLSQVSRLKAPDCPSIDALGAYLDQTSTPEAHADLESHLRSCPSCLNQLAELQELASLEKTRVTPPAHVLLKAKALLNPTPNASQPSDMPWARIGRFLAGTWEAMLQPRFYGGLATAAALSLILFFAGPRVWQTLTGSEPSGTLAVLTDFSPGVQQILMAPISAPFSAVSVALLSRLSDTLSAIVESVEEPVRGRRHTNVYRKTVGAVVYVQTDSGNGSGSLIRYRGQPAVLTNWHVIEGAKELAVALKPRGAVEIQRDLAFAARVIKVDEEADLAILELATPPATLPALVLGDPQAAEVGQGVHAIGHPAGELWTYTTGVISQIRPNYEWFTESQKRHKSDVIQTQTAINPGSSGGPLLNDEGEIVGINAFRGEGTGLNYAVSASAIAAFLSQQNTYKMAKDVTTPKSKPGQLERYGNIVGRYAGSQSPPPDEWYVVADKSKLAYRLQGMKSRLQLDVVTVGADPEWKTLTHYFDLNCNGLIDVIGRDTDGDGEIDRHRPPAQDFALASLAPEFDQALQRGALPYPELRLCMPRRR